ncbi:MAG: transketolase, partial [Patescibacteria group bacterium]
MKNISKERLKFLAGKAVDIREHIINMGADANASHSGSALSAVDVITALYFEIMNINPAKPLWPERDRFILSKGHGGASLYAALAERGYFPKANLKTFCKDEGFLTTHPVIQNVPGVEATTGSLGHGLSIGLGMALAGKFDKKKYRVFVMLSDGECDEGSVWEAAMYAGFHKVDSLVAIVDYNKIQSFGRTKEVMDLEPFSKKWEAFGWGVKEID